MEHYNAKAFVGIFFKTKKEQWEVVPSKWVKQRRQGIICLWPNVEHVEILARNNTAPLDDWKEWEVRRIAVAASKSGDEFIIFSY